MDSILNNELSDICEQADHLYKKIVNLDSMETTDLIISYIMRHGEYEKVDVEYDHFGELGNMLFDSKKFPYWNIFITEYPEKHNKIYSIQNYTF